MACDFVAIVRDEHQRIGHRSVADVVLDTLEEVDAIEQRLTVYDDNSEIAAINRAAGGSGTRVSSDTFDLLRRAQQLFNATGGAFDITAGPLVDAWGFTNRSGRKPTGDEITAAQKLVGCDKMILHADQQGVELKQSGMRINLGGIGKGEAIDRVAARLMSHGIEHFLIHAGQSSVLARGDQFDASENEGETSSDRDQGTPSGWMVGIAHPTKSSRRLAGIWLNNAALATSGSGKQFFHHRGKRYGHVIDPRTGQPAGDLLSLSVMTDRAVDADALATGLFVMGQDQATQFAQEYTPTLPLILVGATQRQDEVQIRTTGDWCWVDPPDDR